VYICENCTEQRVDIQIQQVSVFKRGNSGSTSCIPCSFIPANAVSMTEPRVVGKSER
jgi:hypothetical protein